MRLETVAREASSPERRVAERLFHRDLPGGGFVAIELLGGAALAERRVRIVVERRVDRSRRLGHRPPVVHEDEWRPERGFDDLYRMACDNVEIARKLLRRPGAD